MKHMKLFAVARAKKAGIRQDGFKSKFMKDFYIPDADNAEVVAILEQASLIDFIKKIVKG